MPAPYAPDYASYNWTGAPSNFDLATNKDLGGNSRVENLNKWFQSGDQAYIIIASAMVMVMIPGLAFLYSGLARRKSALSMIWACMGSMSIVIFQWYFWGYSLAFSTTATNGFIGDLRNFGLMKTLGDPSPGSPLVSGLLFAFYQMQFCAVTAAIIMGAVAERGRLMPAMVFVFFWSTLVYCPVVCWVWNSNGWAYKYGVMDYAGGGPVEIVSGMSALAYSMALGRRHERMMQNFRPHNVSLIVLGTVLLWYGWLGFNGGSSFGANLRAVIACWNSNLTAAFAAITWVLLDWRLARKWTMVGWCSGTISGLVAATPASGFIPPWASVILGIVTGVVSNYSTKIKFWLKIDDSMDIFAEHGVAGIVGLLFNALFGDDAIVGLDGVNVGAVNPETHTPVGGWIIHNYRQLYIQVAYIVACMAYSFVVSAIIAYAINYIPGLHLRATEEAELLGMDDDQLGEFAYDFVEVRRDYLAWTPQSIHPNNHPHHVVRSELYGSQAHSAMASRPVQNGVISPSHSTDDIPKDGVSSDNSQTHSGSASRQHSPERRSRLITRVFHPRRGLVAPINFPEIPSPPPLPPAAAHVTQHHGRGEMLTSGVPAPPHAVTSSAAEGHADGRDDLNEKIEPA